MFKLVDFYILLLCYFVRKCLKYWKGFSLDIVKYSNVRSVFVDRVRDFVVNFFIDYDNDRVNYVCSNFRWFVGFICSFKYFY